MGNIRLVLLLVAGFILGIFGFAVFYTQYHDSYCSFMEQLMSILPLVLGVIIAFVSLAALVFYWMTSPVKE